jgi:hypothetical protein
MEDKQAKQIYQQLRQNFDAEDPNSVDALAVRMESVLQDMMALVDRYEKTRTDSLNRFQSQLVDTINDYWHGSFAGQLQQIKALRQESRDHWQDIEPRM